MAMQNINTGQVQSGTPSQAQADAGWVPVSNSNLPQSGGSAGIPSVQSPNISTMTLAQAQQQAEQAFSGIVSPMTIEDIRAREREAQDITSRTAESVYNPQIREKERTGMAQVSTAEGVVGQRQGFNISTAELAFVADTQSKVTQAITEVQNQKQAYIDQGNFNAANRADDQLQKLNEFNAQMTMAKANYALQLMGGSREQAQLELQKYQTELQGQKQQFEMSMAEKNLSISIAGLMGEYVAEDGTVSPTFAAKQAAIQNAISAANLTGYYDGRETLASVTAKADIALRQQGIEIDKARLQETIRANKAQEAISRAAAARSGKAEADESPSGLINAAAQRLLNLRNQDQLTDLNYAAEITGLSGVFGDTTDKTRGDLESMVNQTMEALSGERPQSQTYQPVISASQWEALAKKLQPPTYNSTQAFFGG